MKGMRDVFCFEATKQSHQEILQSEGTSAKRADERSLVALIEWQFSKDFPFDWKIYHPLYSSRHVVFLFWKKIARRVAERNELAGGADAVDEAKVNTTAAFAARKERDGISLATARKECMCTYTESIHTYKHMHWLYSLSWRERDGERALSGHSATAKRASPPPHTVTMVTLREWDHVFELYDEPAPSIN